MRPRSIILFDRLYLASILVALAGAFMSFAFRAELMIAQDYPPDTPNETMSIPAALALRLLIDAGLPLILWFLAGRRRSQVARWIIIVWTVLSALGLLLTLSVIGLVGHSEYEWLYRLVQAMGIVEALLAIAAAIVLLRADAWAWFRGG